MNIKDFTDMHGLVHSSQKLDDNNPIRWTAEWAIILNNPWFLNHVEIEIGVQPGLYMKNVDCYDQVTWDDLIPLAHAFKRLNPEMAVALYQRLHNGGWFYPAGRTSSARQAFLGRSPIFVCHIRHCAKGYSNAVETHIIGLGCILGVLTSSRQDTYALSFHCMAAFDGKSKIINFYARIFNWRLKKVYGTMNKCLESYYGFMHPIAENWPPYL